MEFSAVVLSSSSIKQKTRPPVATEEVANIWVVVVVLSERRQGNCGGEGGIRCWPGGGGDFQLVFTGASLDLEQSSDSAVTTSWCNPFQSGMVLFVLCPAGWDVIADLTCYCSLYSQLCSYQAVCPKMTTPSEK